MWEKEKMLVIASLHFPQCFLPAKRQMGMHHLSYITVKLMSAMAFNLDKNMISLFVNFLTNDKILDVTKFKAFADDKINVVQMMISVFDRVENIVGKGANTVHKHFLLLPQCFQKPSFLGLLKVGILW